MALMSQCKPALAHHWHILQIPRQKKSSAYYMPDSDEVHYILFIKEETEVKKWGSDGARSRSLSCWIPKPGLIPPMWWMAMPCCSHQWPSLPWFSSQVSWLLSQTGDPRLLPHPL